MVGVVFGSLPELSAIVVSPCPDFSGLVDSGIGFFVVGCVKHDIFLVVSGYECGGL